ncbi:pyridoxamine 5'-phosphate oxidase family protein, partial [Caulobacter sp. HMWF025]|uniref:pyridoxamine 5'-phosphate oxidase family protein n=2 Tax=unclassified Caulobacter TaxID=2648921 RepID=UPI000D34D076
LASISESGWPYVQHRGGPKGFLKVLDDRTLALPDFAGNRQYITVGNVSVEDRVSLILVDYPRRARLKILARMEARDLTDDPELAGRLALPGYRARVERALVLRLEAFDWNCPQHITPRFTAAEVEAGTLPLRERLAALEAENLTLRQRLATL